MPKTFTLYGVRADSLDEAAELLSSRLKIQLVPREGLHMGGDYFSFDNDKSNIILKPNVIEDNEIDELDFPGEAFILYLNNYPEDSLFNTILQEESQIFKKLRVRIV